jgi:uncharacterized membrane protein
MISFLAIGFGLLSIAVSLTTLQNSLIHDGDPKKTTISRVQREGISLIIYGLLIILIGSTITLAGEADIVRGAGLGLSLAGFLSIIQWAVYSRKGKVNHVRKGKNIVLWLGAIFVAVYVVCQIVRIFS